MALTTEQKQAVANLEAAMEKCRELEVAFIKDDYGTYAYNNEDVYDIDCSYNDYSVRDIELGKLQCIENLNVYELFGGQSECAVSFYSTTFPSGAEGILY